MTMLARPSPDRKKVLSGDDKVYRKRRAWLFLAALVGASTLGLLVIFPIGPPERSHRTESPRDDEPEDVGDLKESFGAAAFSAAATADDLKQEAMRTADELVEAYPNRTESLAVAARLQYSLGHAHAAKEIWRRSSEIDPGFANAYFGLGVIAKDDGDLAQAAEMFEKVITLAPADHHAPPLLAECLMALGRFEEAVVVLDRHVHTQTVSAAAVVNLGQAYVELKDYEKARQTLEAVIKTYPDDPRGYYALARVHAKLGQTEKSRQYMDEFENHNSVEPEDIVRDRRGYDDLEWLRGLLVKTLWEVGQAYRRYRRPEKAEEMWRKAALLDRTHVACRSELVSLYEEQHRFSAALKVSSELCQIEPKNPDHWLNHGLLNGRLDRLDAALAAIRQAIQLDPDNPTYRQAYELGRREKAE